MRAAQQVEQPQRCAPLDFEWVASGARSPACTAPGWRALRQTVARRDSAGPVGRSRAMPVMQARALMGRQTKTVRRSEIPRDAIASSCRADPRPTACVRLRRCPTPRAARRRAPPRASSPGCMRPARWHSVPVRQRRSARAPRRQPETRGRHESGRPCARSPGTVTPSSGGGAAGRCVRNVAPAVPWSPFRLRSGRSVGAQVDHKLEARRLGQAPQ